MAEEIPQTLDGARVLKYAAITQGVEPTGFTRHTVNGEPFRRASALAVAVYEHDPTSGYYLFYLGDHGGVVTDTLHDSVEAALDQAGREYIGLTWSDVSR